MTVYRSKPTEIEAIQWLVTNLWDVLDFVSNERFYTLFGEGGAGRLLAGVDGASGWVDVAPGTWIVRARGVPSDLWPVDPDYFAEKYEEVEPS